MLGLVGRLLVRLDFSLKRDNLGGLFFRRQPS
jgi:hypothetical protein